MPREGLGLGMVLDDGQHFSIDELAGRLADHPLFVGKETLKAHVVGEVGESGVGAGHGVLQACPEASGGVD